MGVFPGGSNRPIVQNFPFSRKYGTYTTASPCDMPPIINHEGSFPMSGGGNLVEEEEEKLFHGCSWAAFLSEGRGNPAFLSPKTFCQVSYLAIYICF